ncbi:hypothetical protein QE394_001104 [Arthrobacter sp. SORGH_AS 212]|uniref:hypothetical protein n=1 Tax=Pseudarthrobacter sp. SORGH_AS 212 TaxID=3041777 RepID=UPI00277E38DB|nr:hypothetical protein [Arthrobacter sp. SORGH_AS_0212]
MKVYATEAELSEWMTPATVPANAAALLRSASGLVRSSTKMATYGTDADGYPTNTALRTAFRDATTAQAQYWADLGIDPSKGAAGVAPLAASKSIGGASINYSVYATTAEARAGAAGVLGPDAFYILEEAGLLSGSPVVL